MTRIYPPDGASLRRAAAALGAGEVVGCPADTVFGLHVDPFDEAAVARLRALKRDTRPRPFVILCGGSETDLARLAPTRSPAFDALARRHWPGPLTLILDAGPDAPSWVTEASAGGRTIAVRVPGPSVVGRLLDVWRGPLVSTSANRSGAPVLESAEAIAAEFGDEVGMVLGRDTGDDGAPAGGLASTLVDVSSRAEGGLRVLRQGLISVDDANDDSQRGSTGE